MLLNGLLRPRFFFIEAALNEKLRELRDHLPRDLFDNSRRKMFDGAARDGVYRFR